MLVNWKSPSARGGAGALAVALLTAASCCPLRARWLLHAVLALALGFLLLASELQVARCQRLATRVTAARGRVAEVRAEVASLKDSSRQVQDQKAAIRQRRRGLLQDAANATVEAAVAARARTARTDKEGEDGDDALVWSQKRVRKLQRITEAITICLQWSTCGLPASAAAAPTPCAAAGRSQIKAGSADVSRSAATPVEAAVRSRVASMEGAAAFRSHIGASVGGDDVLPSPPKVPSACHRHSQRKTAEFDLRAGHPRQNDGAVDDVADELHASPWTSSSAFTGGASGEGHRSPQMVIESL